MSDAKANRFISMLYRHGQRFFNLRLKELHLDLEAGQIPFFLQVYRHPGITQDQISQNLGMDKGTTCRCIRQLEELGYLQRQGDASDRRVQRLYAAEKAGPVYPLLRQIIDELHQVLYRDLTREEIDTVVPLLRRMKDSLVDTLHHR